MGADRKRDLFFIWCVPAILCLTWLATGWWGRPIGDYGVETDFYGDIVPYARQWLSNGPNVMSGFRGPFYYLLIGMLDRLFGDAFTVAKILSSLAAAVSLVLIGKLLARLWGRVTAYAGILFVAANPIFVMHSFRACTDMVYLVLFVGTLYFLLATEDRDRNWMTAGLFAGLSLLTRYNGFGLFPSALIIALVTVRPIPLAVRRFSLFLAVWLVVAAPWFIFLWLEKGNPLWSNAFLNTAIEAYVSNPGLAANGQFISRVGFESIGEVIMVDPLRFTAAMARNSVDHIRMDVRALVGIPWAAAAFLGLVMGAVWRRRVRGKTRGSVEKVDAHTHRRRPTFIIVGVVVYCSLIPVFYNARFMISLLPFWALGIGFLVEEVVTLLEKTGVLSGSTLPPAATPVGLDREQNSSSSGLPLANGSDRGNGGRPSVSALAVVMVLLVCLTTWTQHREISTAIASSGPQSSPVEILEIAEAARRSEYRFGPDTPIAARKPHIGYYLGSPVVPIPFGTIDQVAESSAEYLLVTAVEVTWAPALRELMLGRDVPGTLNIVARVLRTTPNNLLRGGTLYRFGKTGRHEKPKTGQEEAKEIAGLDRIDTLRLRIAQWYLIYDVRQPIDRALRRIKDQNHIEVLTTWGDLAFLEGKLDRAKQFYLPTLPDAACQAGQEPPGTDNYLRMAAVFSLEADLQESRAAAEKYLRLKGIDGGISPDEFSDIYGRLESSHDRVAQLGLVAAGIAFDTQSERRFRFFRSYGKLLMATGWHEEAGRILETYLTSHPDDTEIIDLLRNPPHRRRQ